MTFTHALAIYLAWVAVINLLPDRWANALMAVVAFAVFIIFGNFAFLLAGLYAGWGSAYHFGRSRSQRDRKGDQIEGAKDSYSL